MAHILIIEDDAEVRTILEKLLSRRWPMIESAENGRVGITLISNLHYDLVITDIVMPEQDGFAVIKEIGRVSPTTKVIAMTAGGSSLNRKQLSDMAGVMKADRLFTKPFKFNQLEQAINELLEAGN